MLGLRERRQHFSVEIRKSELDIRFQTKRKTERQREELEFQLAHLDVSAIIHELITQPVSDEELLARLAQLRQLTCCDGFKLPPEAASLTLLEFFVCLLSSGNPELADEACWCLLNLYCESSFQKLPPKPVVVAFNKLLTCTRPKTLELIFWTLTNISTFEDGAIAVLDDLDFNLVERIVNYEGVYMKHLLDISANILENYPEVEYIEVH